MMKTNIFIIALLITAAVVLEFHPAIKESRVFVPEKVYAGKNCGCECIADSRPWYSVLNYWFWLWFLAVPLLIFSVKPQSPQWQRMGRTLGAVLLCYGAMNLAIHLMWDIRNGPFIVNSDSNAPWQKSWDFSGCANVVDGASLVFTVMFGWLYAAIYAGWWEMAWHQYHKRHTRLIGEGFRRDVLSAIVAFISKILTILGLSFVGLTFIAFSVAWVLEKVGLLPVLKLFFTQFN